MNRKWMIWMVVAVLLTFLYGCPKKKPMTPPSDLNVETTTVPAPAPAPPRRPRTCSRRRRPRSTTRRRTG